MKHKSAVREQNTDPVCGKQVNRNKAHITIEYKGTAYPLCCPVCQAEFEKDPEKYVKQR